MGRGSVLITLLQPTGTTNAEFEKLWDEISPKLGQYVRSNSLTAYKCILRPFVLYSGLPPYKQDALKQYVDELNRLREAGYITSTYLGQIVTVLKTICDVMGWEVNYRKEWATPPDTTDDRTPYLRREQMDMFISAVKQYIDSHSDDLKSSVIGMQDKVMLGLVRKGIRPNDIVNLKFNNFAWKDIAGKRMLVVGYLPCKRGRFTERTLSHDFATDFFNWIKTLDAVLNREKKYVLSLETETGVPVSGYVFPIIRFRKRSVKVLFDRYHKSSYVWSTVKKYVDLLQDQLTVPDLFPYMFRRGVITHLLEVKDIPTHKVNKIFGWKTDMASRYDKRPVRDLADIDVSV